MPPPLAPPGVLMGTGVPLQEEAQAPGPDMFPTSKLSGQLCGPLASSPRQAC